MESYRIGAALAGSSRAVGLAIVTGCYLVAGLAGWFTWSVADDPHPVTGALWADLVATFVVFAGSVLLCNASVYDPYWSVAPPLIALAWAVSADDGVGARQALVLLLVITWSVRLTLNWATGWTGLGHEDWRYVQLRERTRGRLPWWLVNLGGIQLMPTLVVFLAMLPLWPAVRGDRPLGPLDAVAALVTVAAIGVEGVADRQQRRFAADPDNRGRVLDRGLWRHSRHPNYLGEITFWWGLWLFGLAAAPDWWWTVLGPLSMIALFIGVSVPMMDRRSIQRRPGYREHMRAVPALLPWPRRRVRQRRRSGRW